MPNPAHPYELVQSDPIDACDVITYNGEVSKNKIFIVNRGNCR